MRAPAPSAADFSYRPISIVRVLGPHGRFDPNRRVVPRDRVGDRAMTRVGDDERALPAKEIVGLRHIG